MTGVTVRLDFSPAKVERAATSMVVMVLSGTMTLNEPATGGGVGGIRRRKPNALILPSLLMLAPLRQ